MYGRFEKFVYRHLHGYEERGRLGVQEGDEIAFKNTFARRRKVMFLEKNVHTFAYWRRKMLGENVGEQ